MSDLGDRMESYLNGTRKGVVAAEPEQKIPCPRCSGDTPIRIIYYVDIADCGLYLDALRAGWLETMRCAHCDSPIQVRAPVIVDCPAQHLVIFMTHHGDDNGVLAGFDVWLRHVAGLMSPAALKRIRERPFTFVHSWVGLEALLGVFTGEPLRSADPPYPHVQDDEEFSVTPLDGYWFGGLMFYDPRFRALQPAVHLLLGLATQVSDERERDWIIQLLCQFAAILGPHTPHAWIEEEIGRQELLRGNHNDGLQHLHVARACQHTWLTPTASFLDATPSRRANGAVHSENIPSAAPRLLLQRDIRSIRHTVLECSPHKEDYGLWYFPRMMQTSFLHSLDDIAHANGVVIGALLGEIGGPGLGGLRSSGALSGFGSLIDQSLGLLQLAAECARSLKEGFRCGERLGLGGSDACKSQLLKNWHNLQSLISGVDLTF